MEQKVKELEQRISDLEKDVEFYDEYNGAVIDFLKSTTLMDVIQIPFEEYLKEYNPKLYKKITE